MARKKAAEHTPSDAAEGGQHPALATKGKARAAGNLDVIRPGDPDYGKTAAPKLPEKGTHVESEKGFRLSADDKSMEMVRVVKDGKVLFSGSRKDATDLFDSLGDFLNQ